MTKFSHEEFLICILANLLENAGNVAIGSSSPIPAAAALLAQRLFNGNTRALIFRNNIRDPFPESGSELYDRIAQGRIDVFFLSGGQIDGNANLNLVGIGDYPQSEIRFPGCHGLPFIYFMVPRVILFREEHSSRVFVPKVDFISAPGVSDKNIYRRGGPTDLVTGAAAFTFDRKRNCFKLISVHPGYTTDQIIDITGFQFDQANPVRISPEPSSDWLKVLRGPVALELAQTYPEFASKRILKESKA